MGPTSKDASADAGPGLTPELFAQIKTIQIRTQRLVTDLLAGEYESAFKGRGMEFDRVREYQPGDDVRHIDWNVTARMQAPYVKQYQEERQLTVMLLVDVSSSGTFGSGAKTKNEVAAEVAAVLAYVAIRSNDRVGLIVFTDSVEHYIPPQKGRAHVWRVIRDILTFRPERQRTSIASALDYLGRVVRQKAVTFIISDFVDDHIGDALLWASRRHDVTGIWVTDPREQAMPDVGLVELEDAESGQSVLVDTSDAGARADFSRQAQSLARTRREALQRARMRIIDVTTDAPYIDPIVRFFRTHEKRRAG